MDLLFYPLLCILFGVLWIAVEGTLGGRRIHDLDLVVQEPLSAQPLVSIIIPALNEEEHIETALQSVLALDYANLEIIVLNDRSTDATPAILERMQEGHPQMRVIHIHELPQGWLGKTHALHWGAEQAKGEFLLFTDADVRLAPDTVGRAVSRMEQTGLDHLSLIFRPVLPSGLLGMLVVDSLSGLFSFLKPWKAVQPDSRYFFGIGAFNLVRTASYHRSGGHQAIRLCPVDDILLGRIIKESGGRQECLNGRDFVSVPWYPSVRAMVSGLQKNLFAAIDYRFERLVLATILIICCTILPFWGLLFATGVNRLLCAAILVVTAWSQLLAARTMAVPLSCLFWFLLTPYLKLYLMWYAVLRTLIRGGIEWRGTFYALAELREHKVPLWPYQKSETGNQKPKAGN